MLRKILVKAKQKKNTPLVGLEPTTFELEVQCANPLRHRGHVAEQLQKSITKSALHT